MKKSEDSLTALRDGNKTQKQTIEELQKQVKPLQQQEPKFREYSEALSALLAEADEKVAKEEEQKEIKRAEHF